MILKMHYGNPLLLIFITLILGACSAGITDQASPTTPKNGTTKTKVAESADEAAVAEMAAQLLVQSHPDLSPQVDAVIAYVAASSEPGTHTPLQVWEYKAGQLSPVESETLDRALGMDKAQWPERVILFSFDSLSSEAATVDVKTYFDEGISEDSRGGHAAKWYLVNQAGQWVLDRRENPYMNWD